MPARRVAERLWAGEEFWFFSLGVVLWLIAFFGLPRPIVLYVFGHELTHALWVWLMGGRVSRFKVGREGGHILTDKNNFLIALAPYFFPLYSILVIALYGALSLFFNMQPYGRLLYALVGVTWAFHFTFTCWMIPKNQTDLSDNGTIFSLVVIYLINLLLLSAMLVIASPHITFVELRRGHRAQHRELFARGCGALRTLQPRARNTAVPVARVERASRLPGYRAAVQARTPALRDRLKACVKQHREGQLSKSLAPARSAPSSAHLVRR